jgi:hypothetical protein
VGAAVTATNVSWDAVIPPAASADIGFNANWSGSNAKPVAFVLNGKTCLNG